MSGSDATAVRGTQVAAPQGPTTGVAVADIAVSLYIDPASGDDAYNGQTEAQAVQSWERLEELLPSAYRVACTITLLGTTPLAIDDGEHALPRPLGTATPLRVVGSWAQSPGSGGGGTRTIAGGGVGTNTITDAAAGLTVDDYAGFRVRFTSGPASGTKYTVQRNTASVLTLAHAFENGSAPAPGDTFVIEYAASGIYFNDLHLRAPGPVVFDGVFFNGVGAGSTRIRGISPHVLQFSGGPFYVPNARINTQNGRTWIDGSLRSFDIFEGGQALPAGVDGYYGWFMYSGDLYIAAGGDAKGCLVARYIDVVGEEQSVVDLLNADILCVNQLDHGDGALGKYGVTTGNASRVRASTGNVFHYLTGARGVIRGVDVSDSAGDGAYIETGAVVIMEDVTGSGNAGCGCRLLRGGAVVSSGGNTVTGTGGELVVDGAAPESWASVDARLSRMRASGVATT